MSGIIYCLTNPAMPDYVKIGKTNNLQQRLKDLDNTSTPLPFECLYAVEVDDPDKLERLLHDAFMDRRTRRTREFFEVGAERVIAAMNLTGGRDVTPREDIVEDNESQISLDKARERRAAFNFDMVGIPPETELEFFDDQNITCTVVNSRKILFNNRETSLSTSAAEVLMERKEQQGEVIPKWMSEYSIQGPIYWVLNGETMSQRRNRMESE